MQASVTQLILLAVAVAVAAIVTVVVIGVVSDEGENIDKTRNEAALEACNLGGGTYHWHSSGTIPSAGSPVTSIPAPVAGVVQPLGECRF